MRHTWGRANLNRTKQNETTMESKTELKYIFANINEWLKFAEAKHGGLVVLNVGLLVGILSSYDKIHTFLIKQAVLTGIICFGVSVFISIISQFPKTQNLFYNKKKVDNANLYFFGHLTHFDLKSFIHEFKKADANFVPTKLDNDLINQILVNARITQAKFTLFKYASYITAFGFCLIGISSTVKIIWHF